MTEEPLCDNDDIIRKVSIHTHKHVVIEEDLQETHIHAKHAVVVVVEALKTGNIGDHH